MKLNHSQHALALSLTAAILAAGNAHAYDLTLSTNLPPITFHGFASQGFLYTSEYNYLDSDSKNGSFRFFEAGVNASMNPFPRTHITAQGFMFDLGNIGRYMPVLDYASIDYTFNDYIGIRGGRFRRPQGIYNEIVDVDLARTSVLLPQGIYDPRWRDFYATEDGAELFGELPLSKAGSLSYEAYVGVSYPSPKGGVGRLIQNGLPPGSTVDSINAPLTPGFQLWWNTPVDGLRAGAAYQHVFSFDPRETIQVPTPFGPFPVHVDTPFDVDIAQVSLEYNWKAWTFQAEYFRSWVSSLGSQPGLVDDSWYAGASYRFNKWIQVGTYYNEYYGNVHNRDGSGTPVPSDAYQKDWALSLRFDPKPWWVVKVEGHYIHGTGLLGNDSANPTRNNDGWFMLALKTTVSF